MDAELRWLGGAGSPKQQADLPGWANRPWPEVAYYVRRLKVEKDAIILAHNYQRPEIQEVADYVGDSLGLSQQAVASDASTIIFCGVDFMAESAKVLNPEKRVIHPNFSATCPMAAMVDVETLRLYKREHPDAGVVAYINSSAAVKTEADACCTSTNAVKVAEALPHREIIMVPDVNLGLYVQRFTTKTIHLWPGFCHVHRDIEPHEVLEFRQRLPEADFIAHPECPPDIIDVADIVASTEGMFKYIGQSPKTQFIVATEREMAYRLRVTYPDKEIYVFRRALCWAQKRVHFEDLLRSLETLTPEVVLPADVIQGARRALDRMMQIGRGEPFFGREGRVPQPARLHAGSAGEPLIAC